MFILGISACGESNSPSNNDIDQKAEKKEVFEENVNADDNTESIESTNTESEAAVTVNEPLTVVNPGRNAVIDGNLTAIVSATFTGINGGTTHWGPGGSIRINSFSITGDKNQLTLGGLNDRFANQMFVNLTVKFEDGSSRSYTLDQAKGS